MQNYRDVRAMVAAWENGEMDDDLLKEIGIDDSGRSQRKRSRTRPERSDFVSGEDLSENDK